MKMKTSFILQKLEKQSIYTRPERFELLPLLVLIGSAVKSGLIRDRRIFEDDEFPKKEYFKMGEGLNPRSITIKDSLQMIFKENDKKIISSFITEEASFLKSDPSKDWGGFKKRKSISPFTRKNVMHAGEFWLTIITGLTYLKIRYGSAVNLWWIFEESHSDMDDVDCLQLSRFIVNGSYVRIFSQEKSSSLQRVISSRMPNHLDFLCNYSKLDKSIVSSMILSGMEADEIRRKKIEELEKEKQKIEKKRNPKPYSLSLFKPEQMTPD